MRKGASQAQYEHLFTRREVNQLHDLIGDFVKNNWVDRVQFCFLSPWEWAIGKTYLQRTHILLCFPSMPRIGWVSWPVADDVTLPPSCSFNLVWSVEEVIFWLPTFSLFFKLFRAQAEKKGATCKYFSNPTSSLIYWCGDCPFFQFWFKRAASIWAS